MPAVSHLQHPGKASSPGSCNIGAVPDPVIRCAAPGSRGLPGIFVIQHAPGPWNGPPHREGCDGGSRRHAGENPDDVPGHQEDRPHAEELARSIQYGGPRHPGETTASSQKGRSTLEQGVRQDIEGGHGQSRSEHRRIEGQRDGSCHEKEPRCEDSRPYDHLTPQQQSTIQVVPRTGIQKPGAESSTQGQLYPEKERTHKNILAEDSNPTQSSYDYKETI